MKLTRGHWIGIAGVFLATILVEIYFGRLWLGPTGSLGLYSTDVWSSEQSQRLFDPYSFSHFIHGMIFYALLWLYRDKLSLESRFVAALAIEAVWEMLENSPLIINRYREATIAIGYIGDSIVNSLNDIVLAGLGFWFAHKGKIWLTVGVAVACELFTLWWVRDNLTLNVIMLTFPLDSIKEWQSELARP